MEFSRLKEKGKEGKSANLKFKVIDGILHTSVYHTVGTHDLKFTRLITETSLRL